MQKEFRHYEAALVMEFEKEVSMALDFYGDGHKLMFMFRNHERLEEFLDECVKFHEMMFPKAEEGTGEEK